LLPPSAVPALRAIGSRLRAARRASGLSQEDAAAESGVDYKRWQRIEAGTVNVTVRTLVRVAAAVGTTFECLAGGSKQKRPSPR